MNLSVYVSLRLLGEAPSLLDDFDLVAIGVLNEEEAGERLSFVLEIDKLSRAPALGLEAFVLGIHIIDDKSPMPEAVAGFIGAIAILVDRQFELEGVSGLDR